MLFLCNAVLQIIPLSYWCYIVQLLFLVFNPITGRSGAASNPDVLLACLSALLFWITIHVLIPLFLQIRKEIITKIVVLLVRSTERVSELTDFFVPRYTSLYINVYFG